MSCRSCREGLPGVIADMEADVRDLVRWGETVSALGTSDYDMRECLAVVGPAIREVAERVEKAWERSYDLSRDLPERDR